MSLQGSLETIALPDVLSLLASSSKTGELRITGRIDGRLWLQEGKLIASKVGPQPGHVEAVFQLLRLNRGEFLFQEGSTPSEPGEMSAVDAVVRQAQERLAEWRVIESAIPSLEARARLRSELRGPTVTLPADQWRMVVAIAQGGSVRETVEGLGLGEFDGCRVVKELVDADLVTVEALPVRLAAVASEVARRRAFLPVEAVGPVAHAAVVRPVPPVEQNGRTALPAVANGRPAPAEVASAVMALPTRPSVRTRPSPLPPSALEEAVGAAAEAELPPESEPAPQADPIRARRARRPAATRDQAVAEQARAGRPANRVRPPRPAPAEPAATVVAPATVPEPEPDKQTAGDEPINRGLLLKFLSSVRS